ncbi:hypothetical protein HMPREF3137_08750 [Achromobacter xylosoxidans]|nr:hypothetical protein HMPREF3137_08750 [Achromobacter xylosoxidans]
MRTSCARIGVFSPARRVTARCRANSMALARMWASRMLPPLGQGGVAVCSGPIYAGRFRIGRCRLPLEIVVQRLDGLHAGIFHLSVAQLSHRAFRHTSPFRNSGKVGKSNSAQAREDR